MSSDAWTVETNEATFIVDSRTASIRKNGELIDTMGLTNRHFTVLGKLLEKSETTVPYEELNLGIGREGEFQALYDIVSALRSKLGPGLIKNRPRLGYVIRWKAVLHSPGAEDSPEALPAVTRFEPTSMEALSPPIPLSTDGSTRIDQQIGGTHYLKSLAGFWGGEGRLCAMVSISYGVMIGLALLVEVAYRWSEYKEWVIYASVLIGLSSAAVAAMTFELIRRRACLGRFDSLGRAASILFIWSIVLALPLALRLPNEPIVQADFRTMTARIGWSKSVLEALGLPILSLVPLQVVFAFRHLLRSGQTEIIEKTFLRYSGLTGFPGTFVPGPMASIATFTVVDLWWMSANAHLLENLKDGPYYGLFLELAITRVAVGLITLFVVLLWYLLRLNGFKHEAEQRRATSFRKTDSDADDEKSLAR